MRPKKCITVSCPSYTFCQNNFWRKNVDKIMYVFRQMYSSSIQWLKIWLVTFLNETKYQEVIYHRLNSAWTGFLKLVSLKAKAGKPYLCLLNPPIHQSEWPTKARAVLEYLQYCIPIQPAKYYLSLLNPPTHQSEWPIKAKSVSESLFANWKHSPMQLILNWNIKCTVSNSKTDRYPQ